MNVYLVFIGNGVESIWNTQEKAEHHMRFIIKAIHNHQTTTSTTDTSPQFVRVEERPVLGEGY